MINEDYNNNIKSRSFIRFFIGLIPRFINYLRNGIIVNIAKTRGAKVGKNSSVSFLLAIKANSNLIIGENSNIEAHDLDLRQKIIIGDNVIINKKVKIIRQSHNYDSPKFETIGNDLVIGNFAWITSNSLILPSCISILDGAIVAAGSVVVKSVDELMIVGGNPAKYIKKRKSFHNLVYNPALQGRDFVDYIKARFNS